MKKKTLISWSTGKDSAWALHVLRQNSEIEIVGLFCTVNKVFDRVAVHGVRIDLLRQQAQSINLPLHIVYIPYPCSNEEYENAMKAFISKTEEMGIEYFAFGDLFLENVRSYREKLLHGTGIKPLFPIWGTSTDSLSRQMISSGLKAVITCVGQKHLTSEFVGREYNESFINEIPKHIDPCGENGEFHSFAYDGPTFRYPIEIALGEIVFKEDACFIDLLPNSFSLLVQG
jgi:uncharacterized protein (TIGR00290 family)